MIWFGVFPIAGDTIYTTEALLVMDRWLANIEADQDALPLAEKVVHHKPAQARDRCLSLSSLLNQEDPLIPLTGNLLYPQPLIPGLDPSLLPAPPAEAGLVVDALTNQVCGLDLTELQLPGQLADLLSPVTETVATLQQTVVQTRFGTPRTVAGADITTLKNKCQLKPVDPEDYPVNPAKGIFNSQHFANKVAEIFPDGVCDYSQPGVGVVPTQPWLQYGDANQVIEGGQPLPDQGPLAVGGNGLAAPAFEVMN